MKIKKRAEIQTTPDNSNLPGRSKKVRVSGSSRNRELTEQTTGNMEMGWAMNYESATSKLDKYTVLDAVFKLD